MGLKNGRRCGIFRLGNEQSAVVEKLSGWHPSFAVKFTSMINWYKIWKSIFMLIFAARFDGEMLDSNEIE